MRWKTGGTNVKRVTTSVTNWIIWTSPTFARRLNISLCSFFLRSQRRSSSLRPRPFSSLLVILRSPVVSFLSCFYFFEYQNCLSPDQLNATEQSLSNRKETEAEEQRRRRTEKRRENSTTRKERRREVKVFLLVSFEDWERSNWQVKVSPSSTDLTPE